jgi:hypothetical protein
MPQTPAQRKRVVMAKKEGFKKTTFNKVVKGCESSDIKPRGNQTKEEACQNIAGAIKAKQIKRFGSTKVKGRLEVAR